MIVTILLARLSQSQFIISVTVNDFWGAVAVGFIIAASGPTILQKFTALVRGATPSSATTPTGSSIAALSSLSFVDAASATPNATTTLKLVGSNLSSADTSLNLFSKHICADKSERRRGGSGSRCKNFQPIMIERNNILQPCVPARLGRTHRLLTFQQLHSENDALKGCAKTNQVE